MFALHRFAACCALTATTLPAQELLVDLNTFANCDWDECSSYPSEFVAFGGEVYFFGLHPDHGWQLLASDGTPGGTRNATLINDLAEGDVEQIVALDDRLVFRLQDQLWSSDGTLTSAIPIDIGGEWTSFPDGLTRYGNLVVFAATDLAGDREPWATDGTPGGTYRIADIAAGSSMTAPVAEFHELGGLLYFGAETAATGRELWRTDGSALGTELVFDLNPAGDSDPGGFAIVDGWLWFAADDGTTDREPHRTDGVSLQSLELNPLGSSDPQAFVEVDGYCLISGFYGPAAGGCSTPCGWNLWRSDGTQPGTDLFYPFGTPSDLDGPLLIEPMGASAIVAADLGSSSGLIGRFDPSSGNSDLLAIFAEECPEELIGRGGDVLFRTDAEGENLWATDGSILGTVAIPGFIHAGGSSWIADELWLPGRDPDTEVGIEPHLLAPGSLVPTIVDDVWPAGTSDLNFAALATTAGGTAYIDYHLGSAPSAIHTDGSSIETTNIDPFLYGLASLDTHVVYLSNTPASRSVWSSIDPTLPPVLLGEVSANFRSIEVIDGFAYLVSEYLDDATVYRTDGTAGSLETVFTTIDEDVGVVDRIGDHIIYLSGFDQLKSYDVDTQTHSVLVTGIPVASTIYEWDDDSSLSEIARIDPSTGVFVASDEVFRIEDGPGGLTVTALATLNDSFNPGKTASPASVGDRVIFSENNGDLFHLWVSDGTPEGTFEISSQIGVLSSIEVVDGVGYFLGRGNGFYGLWRSDGTLAGSTMLASFSDFPFDGNSGSQYANNKSQMDERAPRSIGSGGKLLFRGNHWSEGNELWISDGTAAGTFSVSDAWPGPASSDPSHMVRVGGKVLLTAVDPHLGRELHVLDFEELDSYVAERYGTGCAGSGTPPAIATSGAPLANQPFDIRVEGAAPTEFALLFLSAGALHLPLDESCSVYLAPPWNVQGVYPTDASGSGGPTMLFPGAPALLGLPLRFQFAVTDPLPTAYGANLSDALEVIVGL